jgi:hypothetical protein
MEEAAASAEHPPEGKNHLPLTQQIHSTFRQATGLCVDHRRLGKLWGRPSHSICFLVEMKPAPRTPSGRHPPAH